MYAYQIKMALFVLTGALSLTAGMGMGALLPVTPKQPHSQRPAPPHQTQRAPLKGGGKQMETTRGVKKQEVAAAFKNLDFTEFDENLMEMLKQPKSTIRASVAHDPEYYTPPSRLPTFQPKTPHQPTMHAMPHGTSHESRAPHETIYRQEPFSLKGGANSASTNGASRAQRNRYQMNTSWF